MNKQEIMNKLTAVLRARGISEEQQKQARQEAEAYIQELQKQVPFTLQMRLKDFILARR